MHSILKYHASTGPKKWILWIVVSITVFIAVFALYMKLNKRRQEIEKMHNEADLAAQKAEQVRADILREKDQSKLVGLLDQAHELQKTADAKRNEIAKSEKEFEADLKQVKALESWKDLDAYNQKSRS
jgi:predicted transposase YdaD